MFIITMFIKHRIFLNSHLVYLEHHRVLVDQQDLVAQVVLGILVHL